MRGIFRIIKDHYGKIAVFFCMLVAVGSVTLSSSKISTAEVDYNLTLQPLAPYIAAEKVVNKELALLNRVKDRATWGSARNESNMDESVKQSIYGLSAEDFDNFLQKYNVVEILFDYKDAVNVSLLYRMSDGTDLITVRVMVVDSKIMSMLIY